MNDEHGHDAAASEALSRLKSSSSTSREPFDQQQFEDSAVEDSPETESPTPTSADPSAEQEPGTTPATPTESTEPVEPTEPAPGEPARKSPEVSAEDKALWTVSFNTGSGEEQRKDTLGTRLTTWLDSFGGPDMDKVEADIADTPARLRRHWLKHRARQTLKKRRAAEQAAAERRAREERERLEAEVAEIQQILAVQAAERAAEERERQRLAEMELLKAQQERETQALVTAARELDGTDYVPAPITGPCCNGPGKNSPINNCCLGPDHSCRSGDVVTGSWKRPKRLRPSRPSYAQTKPTPVTMPTTHWGLAMVPATFRLTCFRNGRIPNRNDSIASVG